MVKNTVQQQEHYRESLPGFLSFLAPGSCRALPESKKILLISFLFAGLFFTTVAYAQPYTSRLGRFQVDQIKGCAPFTVTITDTNLITISECTPGKPCLMDFEGKNQQQQNQFTFTYITPGTYTLSVLYQSIGADDITITVVENTVPAFEVYTCSGNKVSVKITDLKYQNYTTDYNGDGVSESGLTTSQYNYGTPGNYNIRVHGINNNAADNCATNTQAFTAVTALPVPSISALTAVDGTSLKMDFPVQLHMQLKSEIAVNKATPFQQYQTLYEVNTTTATSLKVDDNYYCFRLNNFDPCANLNNYSPVVCSQNFDLSIASGVNNLTWTTSPVNIQGIDIQRNNQSYVVNLPAADVTYNDTDVLCKTNYCYTLISRYAGGAISTSLQKCGEAFTTITPSQLDNISSVVGIPQGVDLSWLVSPAINTPEFNVYRSGANGAYLLLGTTKDTKFTDPDYKTEESYCYRINYTDACGNTSLSGNPVCPIRLTGSLGEKNVADLSWVGYDGWLNGVNHYVIEKYTTSGQLLSSVDLGTSVNYKDDPADPQNQVIRYVIKAYANETGVTLSSSNPFEIAKNTNLFSPTAFTPNGDLLNDNFVVIGYYITKLQLKIFDRWGGLIYTTDKNEPWNGTRSGSNQPMPPGAYVWKAEITDFTGKTFSEEGTVMLIRKSN